MKRVRARPELQALVGLFYPVPDALGSFYEVSAAHIPEPYARLLDHSEHMTVTVEAHHGSSVEVEVLATHVTETHYSRCILLRRTSDRRVVQFGIVRLNRDCLDPAIQSEIESQQAPLGRILIQHGVLRDVRLLSLWRVDPGVELCRQFGLAAPIACYGRTALIYCNGVPAVELLEIVTPQEDE